MALSGDWNWDLLHTKYVLHHSAMNPLSCLRQRVKPLVYLAEYNLLRPEATLQGLAGLQSFTLSTIGEPFSSRCHSQLETFQRYGPFKAEDSSEHQSATGLVMLWFSKEERTHTKPRMGGGGGGNNSKTEADSLPGSTRTKEESS